MRVRPPAFAANLFAVLLALAVVPSAASAQRLEGCSGRGVSPPVESYLPNLRYGFVVVSDERRDAEQLAATFADPADALSRLNAYCWLGQAERVYARDGLTVDVSIHDFIGPEGATLAQHWFSYQRSSQLGLAFDSQAEARLQEEEPSVDIDALDDVAVFAYFNDSEYTLYARRDTVLTRISVSGESSAGGKSRVLVAYQVLALVFPIDLFPYPHAEP